MPWWTEPKHEILLLFQAPSNRGLGDRSEIPYVFGKFVEGIRAGQTSAFRGFSGDFPAHFAGFAATKVPRRYLNVT